MPPQGRNEAGRYYSNPFTAAESTGFDKDLVPLVQDVVARYPNQIDRREKLRPESMEAPFVRIRATA